MKLRANVNLEFVSLRAVSSTRSDLSVWYWHHACCL